MVLRKKFLKKKKKKRKKSSIYELIDIEKLLGWMKLLIIPILGNIAGNGGVLEKFKVPRPALRIWLAVHGWMLAQVCGMVF